MKIGYVCCEYPPALHGGIGTYIQTLGRSLVRNGGEVRVAGIYPSRMNLAEYEEDGGVRVWRFRDSQTSMSWAGARYRLFKTLKGWAAGGELDLLEVPDWEGYAALWPSLGIPVVVRLHGSLAYFAAEMGYPVARQTAWLEKRSFHRADFCCSTSDYTARRTEQIFGKHAAPISVLYCPVDMQDAVPQLRDRFSIVFAGTLTRKKGIIQLIKAWPEVLLRAPEARLQVYGKDEGTDQGTPMVPYLESLLDDKCRRSVQFHGHIRTEQLRKVYQSCGAAAFPSYSEAFSLAPVEAMSAGCPVIYSKKHSGPELMTDAKEGLLIDPDCEKDLAAAILRLIENAELAERLGIAGQRHVRERFAAEKVLERNRAFYSHCIDAFRQGSRN
jgi:glycosyltransferase involved in cell wall biosynthesis